MGLIHSRVLPARERSEYIGFASRIRLTQAGFAAGGIAISIDALLALVLFLSMVALLSMQPLTELSFTQPKIATNQLIADAVTALDNTGFIIQSIEESATPADLSQAIHEKLDALLPATLEYRLELKQHDADLGETCKEQKTFAACFPEAPTTLFTSTKEVPEGKDVFHGRKIFIKKEPGDCEVIGQLEEKKEKGLHLYFADGDGGAEQPNFVFDSEITDKQTGQPITELSCGKEATVQLSAYAEAGGRQPVDIMIVLDKSGSMDDCAVASPLDVPENPLLSYNGSSGESEQGTIGGENITETSGSVGNGTRWCDGWQFLFWCFGTWVYDDWQDIGSLDVANSDMFGALTTWGGSCSDWQCPKLYIESPTGVKYGFYGDAPGNVEYGPYDSSSKKTFVFVPGSASEAGTWSVHAWNYGSADPYTLTISNPVEWQLKKTVTVSSLEPLSLTLTWEGGCSGACPKMYVESPTGAEYGYERGAPPGGSYASSSTSEYIFIPQEASENGDWSVWLANDAEIQAYDLLINHPNWKNVGSFFVSEERAANYGFDTYLHWDTDCTDHCPNLMIENTRSGTKYGYVCDPTCHYVAPLGDQGCLSQSAGTPTHRYIAVSKNSSNWGTWDVWVWEEGPQLNYTVTANIIEGPSTKMDEVKNATANFINYEDEEGRGWDSPDPGDKLGLVSYSTSASLDHQLVQATPENKQSIIDAVNSLTAGGWTAVGEGIHKATVELTTGNPEPNPIKVQILLSDGMANTGTWKPNSSDWVPDPGDPYDAVIEAKNNEAYVFTIGFGIEADEQQLQEIAANAYCGETGTDCGTYHYAADPAALEDIYNLIAGEIGELAGITPDPGTTDIGMDFTMVFQAGFEEGFLYNFSPLPAVWDGETLQYTGIDVHPEPWTASFDVMIPCDYADCADDFVEGQTLRFPPDGTTVGYELDGVPQEPLDWDVSVDVALKYADIVIDLGGTVFGADDITVNYIVENKGYFDIDLGQIQPTVNFYYHETEQVYACDPLHRTFLDSVDLEDYLDAAYDGGGKTDASGTIDLQNSGYICAWLNEEQDVSECSANNTKRIYCKVPETHLYVLDYWAWEK